MRHKACFSGLPTSQELATHQLGLFTKPAVAGAGSFAQLQLRIYWPGWGVRVGLGGPFHGCLIIFGKIYVFDAMKQNKPNTNTMYSRIYGLNLSQALFSALNGPEIKKTYFQSCSLLLRQWNPPCQKEPSRNPK